MYGMLSQDLARTVVTDREREISRMAIERAAVDPSAPRLHQRLMAAVRSLRGLRGQREYKPVAAVRPAAPSVAH